MCNKVISVRLLSEDRELLDRICSARREDISGFVRRAIRKEFASLSYLSAEDKKALGVKEAFQDGEEFLKDAGT
jgi:predicted transcriptional regulator